VGLIDRAKAILLTPKQEWASIEAEPASTGSLFKDYAIPLAAIPAVASFVGLSLVGGRILGIPVRVSVTDGITGALIRFVGTLAGVYVLALIIDALAPNFGGQKNQVQALKVAAYSSTASWVAGIFAILPALSILSVLGLYSLYLLFLGLPRLMKVPEERAMLYTVVVVVGAIAVFILVNAVTKTVVPMPGLVL